VTNWPDYDAALVRRGELTVWLTEEAIASWYAPATGERGGQPIYSAIAIETALTLRLVFHQPLRQTEGLLRSIAALLGIDIAIPDHTTLSCREGGLTVLPKSIGRDEPLHLLIDSTGLKIYGEGEWLDQKRGIRSPRRWRKLHLGAISILQPSRSMVASVGSVVLATTGEAWLRPRCISTKPSLAGVYTLGFCPVSGSKQRLDATH
jgi:hypothetical protein